MKQLIFKTLLLWILVISSIGCFAQEIKHKVDDSIQFQGQLSGWAHYNFKPLNTLNLGIRYIPDLQYELKFAENHAIDVEASANIMGNTNIRFPDSIDFTKSLKPYRLWVRYTTHHLEIRVGLQKINFGSAEILRPLMWFDQVDARDPLHLSTGVYGALLRYYFINNAKLWLWTLYGNKKPKGWEVIPSNKNIPEFGGRFQWPLSMGEVALSYHHRTADSRNLNYPVAPYAEIGENRYGFDIKLDLTIGWWMEASLVSKTRDMGVFTNQEMINMGIDYTFGIGNGLNMSLENLLSSYDTKTLSFENTTNITALSANYPINFINNMQVILYYDWTHHSLYNFVNWYQKFNKITFYVMAYWNPENNQYIYQQESGQYYAGKGVQIMVVYNH